jgi:uncharacterized membrane protein
MEVYLTLKWLHIITAGIVLGLLAAYPMLPGHSPRDALDARATRHVLAFLDKANNWLLIPSIVLLFVTGILMSVGPFAIWNLFEGEGFWIILGMVLWLGIAGIVAGLMAGVIKEMKALVDGGEAQSPRMGKLWKQFRWGLIAGIIVTLAALWVMVFQPGFRV